jgi:hypothetical protein
MREDYEHGGHGRSSSLVRGRWPSPPPCPATKRYQRPDNSRRSPR